MIAGYSFFCNKNSSRGAMMMELLLSVALAALIIPFVFNYQHHAVVRAENIAVARHMQDLRDALERYIVANREKLLLTRGRNITRVTMPELVEYGAPADLADNAADRYQMRVLKSSDASGQATLQGVVVMSAGDITPMRTREIVEIGGGQMGFVEGNRAYGAFGTWRADAVQLGVSPGDAIVQTTSVNRDNSLYLWRVPSDSVADATMLSGLNLGGHDVLNATFFDADNVMFDETLDLKTAVADNVIFQNRTTIDKTFETVSATVSGTLSADARNMEISGALQLADVGKFSNFVTGDLWTTTLTLSGLSINSKEVPAILKINRALDMTAGRITAMYVTVGFTGSITPRLVVTKRIEDSVNPGYFWDVSNSVGYMYDVTLMELNRMASDIVRNERDTTTTAGRVFGAVSANKNATVSDYMNAITEIQNAVRAKYRKLNLE